MTHEELIEVFEKIQKDAVETLKIKNRAYASNGDALANYKEASRFLGCSKYETWGNYFFKHVSSIFKAIRDNPESPVDMSEGLRSRIIDAITYLGMLEAMLVEDATITIFVPGSSKDMKK